MAFVGFDLDETLGRFSVPDGHLYFLMPEVLYTTQFLPYAPFHQPSDDLKTKLTAAFNSFAVCLANKEPALGMLRPGILQIVGKLSQLKDAGRINGIVVYSNNGNLAALILATKMIEHLLQKPGLFCNRVNWWNPMRYGPGKNIKGHRPGAASKSTRVLRESFVGPMCGNIVANYQEVPVDQLLFFDDLNPPHQDIFNQIGPERYFRVNPYKKDASIAAVNDCFYSALESQNLHTDPEYLTYINTILQSSQPPLAKTFASINTFLTQYNAQYALKNDPFLDDTDAILARIDALFPPLPAAAAAEAEAEAGAEVGAAVEGENQEGGPAAAAAAQAPVAAAMPNNYGANFFPLGGRRKIKRRRASIKKQTKKRKTRHRKGYKRTRKN